ncbi:hypothetical protein RIR_e15658_A0A2I1FRM4_9GLOM [Rhizophagus irregularis DAOM 181602=DAOM 197198]|nr:hypothetical protein RhiirB3_460976 [Rhizophagus irregularis]GET59342.1 hypothetical protein RIR_e15658_A0A2I1FRM4_9GLOM [Rhizophagus irregularis DAOM 181602=DAOM 197198]
MGQVLTTILTHFNISFNLPCLFLSDSATYMKIINLIGDMWRTLPQFHTLKCFLDKIKEVFVNFPS